MEELEYVFSRFDSHFGRFRGKRIALHGTREYARGILERFDGTYHFSGVMTAERQGEFCGKPVLDEDALAQDGIDLLILTERVKYAEEVYRRLQAVCRAQHIGLYNMYGVDEMETHRAYEAGEYLTLTRWKARCAPFDVIAFEAMDAMLTQASQLLAAVPVAADFQFDIYPDGHLSGTFAIDAQFSIEQPDAVRRNFEDGPAARIMNLLESWGIADERRKLGAESAFARAIPVELDDGQTGRYAFTLMPQWAKVRWIDGVLQPAKLYLLAHAGLISE